MGLSAEVPLFWIYMNNSFLSKIPPKILMRLKGIDLNAPGENCHEAINELLQKSVLLGGKRLRPLLTYLFADFFGVPLSDCDVPARAIEMVHAASLAHDDVIDEASIRRGSPSINIQASNKKAVLAGDFLLATVIGELSRTGKIDLVKEMALVIEGLAEGEWLQSDLILSKNYTAENIEAIAKMKTSSVMTWCAVAPAVIKGLGPEIIHYCKSFGTHLGLGFQLLDDTLDFSGDSQKDALLDLKNGQINSVLYKWLEYHPDIKSRFHNGEDILPLFNEDKLDLALEETRNLAKEHLNKCRELIDVMSDELKGLRSEKEFEKSKSTFRFILDYLESRTY